MTLRTCTKVNIGLNVLRKRPDGYHDLETLFVPYSGFGDLLSVEPSDRLTVEIERAGGIDWDPMNDLTVRAWQLLRADFPSLPAVSIHLEKHSPVGAGLGGGSADAAFMLRALNELGSLGLDDGALAAYAARLGSDCAFFIGRTPEGASPAEGVCFDIYGSGAGAEIRPMFATGRGEILEPFDIDLSGYELRVEIPSDSNGKPVAVSTREAYSGIVPRENAAECHLDQAQPSYRPDRAQPSCRSDRAQRAERSSPLRDALRLPVEQWKGLVVNDFEATVCPLHPEIPTLIADFYKRGAVYAAMSGSGAAVFGLFRK